MEKSLLEFSISKSNSKSISKETYDFNKGNSKYDQLNNQYSNDFENTYGFTNAGIRMRTQKKKYNYAFGINLQQAALEGKITRGIKDSVISKTFRNFLPNARFQYNLPGLKVFRLHIAHLPINLQCRNCNLYPTIAIRWI